MVKQTTEVIPARRNTSTLAKTRTTSPEVLSGSVWSNPNQVLVHSRSLMNSFMLEHALCQCSKKMHAYVHLKRQRENAGSVPSASQ